MLGGLILMGVAGWEASSYLGCCHQMNADPEGLSGPSEGCDDSSGCCSQLSRAGVVSEKPASACTEDCCGEQNTAHAISTVNPAAEGWATIKGKVVFGGDVVPRPEAF